MAEVESERTGRINVKCLNAKMYLLLKTK
jgi:hypothetical protein